LDFQKAGQAFRQLGGIFIFLNSNIQGFKRFISGSVGHNVLNKYGVVDEKVEAHSKKQMSRFWINGVLGTMTAQALLSTINGGRDDKYDKKVKDKFWVLTPDLGIGDLFIPKSHEDSTFSRIAERLYSGTFDSEFVMDIAKEAIPFSGENLKNPLSTVYDFSTNQQDNFWDNSKSNISPERDMKAAGVNITNPFEVAKYRLADWRSYDFVAKNMMPGWYGAVKRQMKKRDVADDGILNRVVEAGINVPKTESLYSNKEFADVQRFKHSVKVKHPTLKAYYRSFENKKDRFTASKNKYYKDDTAANLKVMNVNRASLLKTSKILNKVIGLYRVKNTEMVKKEAERKSKKLGE
jgi:hypothetical protein